MDWLDLLAVQWTRKSLLQHHSSKASILQRSAFFTVQLSYPYMTTGKTIALTRRTFVDKVMSLPFHMLSRLVITFLQRLLIPWLQSPSAVILEPRKINSDTVSTVSPSISHLHNPDNHKGVITHLQPDILECKVKWALESITMNKASWGDSSWALSNPERWCCESAALNMPANLEKSAVATGLEKVSFHSNPKERQCQRMLTLPHNCTHLTC